MQFLALDARNGTPAQVNGFLAQAQITYPLLVQAAGVTALYAGAGRYDYVYVVGGDGRVAHRRLARWDTAEVQSAVDDALEDLAVTSAPSTRVEPVRLVGPVPNPFNPRTALRVSVPGGDDVVSLVVLDARGRLVRTLLDGEAVTGDGRTIVWDGADDGGRLAPSGVYHFRLTSSAGTIARKGVLIR